MSWLKRNTSSFSLSNHTQDHNPNSLVTLEDTESNLAVGSDLDTRQEPPLTRKSSFPDVHQLEEDEGGYSTPSRNSSSKQSVTPSGKSIKGRDQTPTKVTTATSSLKALWHGSGNSPRKTEKDWAREREELERRIKKLEEQLDMSENFKNSLKETLGLQVESLRTELELEREKVQRLEDTVKSHRHQEHMKLLETSAKSSEFLELLESSRNEAIKKLKTRLNEEKSTWNLLQATKENNKETLRVLNENVERLLKCMKEETIFVQQLKEQKLEMETSPNYKKGLPQEKQLLERLAVADGNVKKFSEQLDRERKQIKEIEEGKLKSVIDEKLADYIELHQELVDTMNTLADESQKREEHMQQLQRMFEQATQHSVLEREHQHQLATLQAKQLEDAVAVSSSLQSELEQLTRALNEEKIRAKNLENQVVNLNSQYEEGKQLVERSLQVEKELNQLKEAHLKATLHNSELIKQVDNYCLLLEETTTKLRTTEQSLETYTATSQEQIAILMLDIEKVKLQLAKSQKYTAELEVQVTELKQSVSNLLSQKETIFRVVAGVKTLLQELETVPN